MNKIKVLFLAASPVGEPLRLDEEIREITNKIRASKYPDALDIVSRWAVRPGDLQQCLLEHQPHVVHFSGHGNQSEEIILLDVILRRYAWLSLLHKQPKTAARQSG